MSQKFLCLQKSLTRRIFLIARNGKVGTVKFVKTLANTVNNLVCREKDELHRCNGDEMHRTKGDVEDANTDFFQLFRLVV